MTLENLRQVELTLMRQAFETACARAGLSTSADASDLTDQHARLAHVVQSLVEQGYTDVRVIAGLAAEALTSNQSKN